jgi:hypothetical protein
MRRSALVARLALPLAVGALAVSATPARAAFILSTDPGGTMETRLVGNTAGGITTALTVGPADVTITGFGTYGRMRADGNLRFVIFVAADRSAPVFDSGPVATAAAAAAGWYDSPDLSFTLLAGTEYRLGVIADQDFTYTWDARGPTVTAGGLTLLGGRNGNTGPSFGAPIHFGDGGVTNSLRVLGPTPTTANPAPPGVVLALTGAPVLGLFWLLHGVASVRAGGRGTAGKPAAI